MSRSSGGCCLGSVGRGRHLQRARSHRLRERGVPPKRLLLLGERLQGTALANGAGGMGCPSLVVLTAWRPPAGDGIPHLRGPYSWGDGAPCPGSGRCLGSAREGRLPPLVWSHWVGGRGVPSWRWSLPGERQWGRASPIGTVPPAGATGCPAKALVAARRAPAEDGIPHWRGPNGWGDGAFRASGGRCPESVCGGPHPIGAVPLAGRMGRPAQAVVAVLGAPARGGSPLCRGPTGWGTRCPTQAVVAAWKASAGVCIPHWRGPTGWVNKVSHPGGGRCVESVCQGRHPPLARSHWLEGWCVPPRWWSLPRERLRGTVSRIGAVPPAGGTGCPTQVVVAAWRASAGVRIPHWRGPSGRGDPVSHPGGGRCPESACGRRYYPLAQSHRLGEQGVPPKRWSLPRECLPGTASPIGAVSLAGGMMCPIQVVVVAWRACVGDYYPRRRGLIG